VHRTRPPVPASRRIHVCLPLRSPVVFWRRLGRPGRTPARRPTRSPGCAGRG